MQKIEDPARQAQPRAPDGAPSRAPLGPPRPPWWRRRYLVNRDLQLRFAWSAVLVGLVSSSVSSFMILLSFWSFNIWQGQRLPAPVMVTILFVMFTNVAGIYVVAVLTTQRIAGPIFNLIRQFSELSQHNFSARARFRRKDELQYVALRFNEMADRIEERDHQIFERLRHLQDCVAPGAQLPADSSVLASQIHAELSQLLGDGIFRNAHGGAAAAPQTLQGEQG